MREDQAIGIESLRRIRARESGWEAAWSELHIPLEQRVVRIARRVSGWPDPEHDVEDFVADYLLELYRKAERGTLLAAWNEASSVLAFLTAMVPLRILSFLKKRSRELGLGAAADDRAAPYRRHEPLQRKLDGLLSRLVIRCPEGRITRTTEQGGLQLHPRLEWPRPEHERLREHLCAVIAVEGEGWGPRQWRLDREHAAAALEIRERMSGYAAASEVLRRGSGEERLAEFERKLDEALFDLHFCPLAAERLVALLELASINNGEQLRSRYKKALPELLTGLRAAYERILELVPEEGPFLTGEDEDEEETHP